MPCRKLYGRSIEDAVAGMHNRTDGQGAMLGLRYFTIE